MLNTVPPHYSAAQPNIKPSFGKVDSGGSIPPNMLEPRPAHRSPQIRQQRRQHPYTERCQDAGQKVHPARFPASLPEFFIKLLTDEGDIVVDPFAGSNTTGAVAERLERRWVAVERVRRFAGE